MDKKNICSTCKFATADLYCNRLVVPSSFGMNDRLGSDYKKNNECPYHEDGNPRKEEHKALNFWNS